MKYVKRFTDALTLKSMQVAEALLTLIFIAMLSGCGKLSTLGHNINSSVQAPMTSSEPHQVSSDASIPIDEPDNVFNNAASQLNSHDQLVCGSVLLVADRFSTIYTKFLLHETQTSSDLYIDPIVKKTLEVLDQEEQNLPADQKQYFDMGYGVVIQFVANVVKLRPAMNEDDPTNYINPTDLPPAITQWCNGSLAHLTTPFVYEGTLTIPYNLIVK